MAQFGECARACVRVCVCARVRVISVSLIMHVNDYILITAKILIS